jgi:hypothetical protein
MIARAARAVAGLAGLALAAACSSPMTPTPAPPAPAPPPPNAAPVVQSVQASVTSRTEVNTDVTLTAAVSDAETPVDTLTYTWTASVGTIAGAGRSVTWRLARGAAATPQNVTIMVAVSEPFQTLENGVLINRQHRIEATAAPFRVHDSPAEAQGVSLEFLRNFSDNSTTPQFCVKDFSDACPGKNAEIGDIERVRRGRFITNSVLTLQSATFNTGLTGGTVQIGCRFDSTVVQKIDAQDPYFPGDKVSAEGTCTLTLVYEAGLWKLCASTASAPEVKVPGLQMVAPRRTVASMLFGYGGS